MISTKIVKIDRLNPEECYLKEAADILAKGGLVIIPTETVYGIAANMLNKETINRLCKIKERPLNKPFSVHIDEKIKVEDFAAEVSQSAYKLINKFWPGPLTLILKSKEQGKIGLRLPDNEIARRIIGLSGAPVVCPSANISGQPAPVNFRQAIENLNGLVEFAIDSGSTELEIESSVVDLSVMPPEVLREGAIKKDDIQAAVAKKTILFVCTGNTCRSVMAKALLDKKLKEKNRSDVEILSAGMAALVGMPATEAVREILKKEGIDVSGHRCQNVAIDMIKAADIILAMEKVQEERILGLAPEVKNRLFLLKEFAKITSENLDIIDPIGRGQEFYEQTFKVIKESIERVSNII